MAEPLSYNASGNRTVGVEVELQLLSREDLMFSNCAPDVISNLPDTMTSRIKEELITCMVEINTRVCKNINQVRDDLRESMDFLDAKLDSLESVSYSGSLHPLERGTGDNVTVGSRYKRIMDELQIVGRRFITQGLHVHIGVENPECAIRINNAMRMYLPMLLALSTSSPYYQAEDTGMYSYRSQLFEALPLAGMPNYVEGWEGFSRMVELLRQGGIIETPRDLWWDVRPNPVLGTVEVRICDLPSRFDDIIALTALIQVLVCTLMNRETHPAGQVDTQILRANKWHAARYGLDGVFISPVDALRTGMREAIEQLLDFVAPMAQELGSEVWLEHIRLILKRGTGADRQRELYKQTGDFRQMITALREEFYS